MRRRVAPHDITDYWVDGAKPAKDGRIRLPQWGVFTDEEVRLALAAEISPLTLRRYTRQLKELV